MSNIDLPCSLVVLSKDDFWSSQILALCRYEQLSIEVYQVFKTMSILWSQSQHYTTSDGAR